MRLIMTGSSGFIGTHVKNYILHDVELLCIEHSEYNLHDFTTVQGIIKAFRPTHCLHLAWCAGKGYANAAENKQWVHSSLNLIEHFYAYGGRRFVGAGTCFEYTHTGELCDEKITPTVPQTAYGFAKLCIASYLQSLCLSEGISFAWCRPFYLLGPGEPAHRLIPTACKHFLKREDFTITNGNTPLDYMDARDVARALMAVLLSNYDGIVNIGAGRGVTVGELLTMLKGLAHAQSNIITSQPQCPHAAIVANNDILQNKILFSPSFTIRQSLSDCYYDVQKRLK